MPRTQPKRPVRAVTLPGGDAVHVRGLTLAELRKVDEDAAAEASPALVNVRTAELVAARSVVDADGSRWFGDDEVGPVAELFTPDQMNAILEAAAGQGKDAAKNG
jgi:LmbE family N-acetylglucosaminyl deacetylase